MCIGITILLVAVFIILAVVLTVSPKRSETDASFWLSDAEATGDKNYAFFIEDYKNDLIVAYNGMQLEHPMSIEEFIENEPEERFFLDRNPEDPEGVYDLCTTVPADADEEEITLLRADGTEYTLTSITYFIGERPPNRPR